MTTLDGLDYYSHDSGPAPEVTAKAGLTMVFRYLFDSGKGMTGAEALALHAQSLGIGCYYEAHSGYLLDPTKARSYGLDAADAARAVGVPRSVPICHSLDVNTVPDQFPTVAKSMQAINAVRGRKEGFYGEADAIDYLWGKGLISFAVNTAAVGWSGGRVSSHAAVWQYKADTEWNGHNVDLLTIRNQAAVNAALWWPAGHTPPSTGDPDMDSTEKKMLAYVYQQIRGAVAPGTTGFAGTIKAITAAAQHDVNVDNAAAVQLAAIRAELTKMGAGQ